MTGKMSLVCVQSWTERKPTKIRAIAPPDNDYDNVIMEPDHQGRFFTEEISKDDPRFNSLNYPRERAASAGAMLSKRRKSQDEEKVAMNGSGGGKSDNISNMPLPIFLRKKAGLAERNLANRHSYGGVNNAMSDSKINTKGLSSHENGERFPNSVELGHGGRSASSSALNLPIGKVTPPETLSIRPGSGSSMSPEHPDGMEYTPPSSPVTGRYRNLGPELAATIPKRTIKSSWISGIKSRWMKSTTHPESCRRSTLKSYSSSPSLVLIDTTSDDLKESEFLQDLEESCSNPFFNPLYKIPHPSHLPRNNLNRTISLGGNCNNSTGSASSSSGIVLSADDDSQSDRSRSSLSNPISYSPSPPPSSATFASSSLNNPLQQNLQNRSSSPSPDPSIGISSSPTANLRRQIVSNSSRPNGLLQKVNSLTDFNEEDYLIYGGSESTGNSSYAGRSLTGSPYGLADDSSQTPPDCVLVEVIRKPPEVPNSYCLTKTKPCTANTNNKSNTNNNNPHTSTLVAKRHSVGELESIDFSNNKFAGVKVEGNPGKVARIKESIKRYGRFGRGHSEKILRFKSDYDFDEEKASKSLEKVESDEIKESKNSQKVVEISSEQKSNAPKPTVRKRSLKTSSVEQDGILKSNQEPTLNAYCCVTPSNTNKTETHQVKGNEVEQKPQKGTGDDSDSDKVNQSTEESNNIPFKRVFHSSPTECTNQARKVFEELISPVEENEEPISSIIGDQDRSMSLLHIQPLPTIDIVIDKSCLTPTNSLANEENFPVVYNTKEVLIDSKGNKGSGTSGSDNSNKQEDNQKEDGSINNINKHKKTEVGTSDKDNKHVILSADPKKVEEEEVQMFRRNVMSNSGVGGGSNGASNSNESKGIKGMNKLGNSMNGHSNSRNNIDPIVGVYNRHVKGGLNHFYPECASPSSSLVPELDEHPQTHYEKHDSTNKNKIGHGKYSSQTNGVASVQVPVQAINRHVIGYGGSTNYANSIEDDRGSGSHSAASSSESRSDSDWQRSSSTRESFRGFCEGLLKNEKITIEVPEVEEASINFDNEDTSSLDPDEERENSVEYISIADVKVNHKRNPDVDQENLPSCVISLDIGSRGSGYSYWIKEEPECVRIGNVDTGSACPRSHKSPSWVSVDDLFLDIDDEEDNNTSSNSPTSPGFGYQALDRFLSNENDNHSHQHQLFWKWRENFNEASIFPYTLESKPTDEELQLTMKSAIRHYARLALDQIDLKKRVGGPHSSTIFMVAIPSNFDSRARKLVRDAAFGSGIVTQKDALSLIEDPCAAGIYAYHALKSKISKFNNHETCYLSVDIGGVFLHSSGYEISEGKLHLILSPKSVALADSPESLFETELSSIFTPSFIFNYQNKYKAGWLKLMTEFERCKNLYDPVQRGSYHVFVPSSFVDHFRRFTSMEVDDALESSDILWSKVGALGIPYWKMQRFLQPLMENIKDYIINLIKKHNYEYLVLTGGRVGSRHLVDFIKNAVRDFSVEVVVPKEYNAAVLQGSTISLTNLAPRLIIKSPFSIGVGVMTPFLEDHHPEEKRVLRDGKSWCADVWDSLIKVGQDLELNKDVLKRSYVGAQPGQSFLCLPLFKSSEEPRFVTESSVQKCCEFKFNSSQRAWQEVELVIKCRPSELIISALDGGVLKNVVVVDFAC